MAGAAPPVGPDDWLQTVGMFEADPGMDRIYEAGRRLRVSQRRS